MDLKRVVNRIKPDEKEKKEMNGFIEKLLEVTKSISSDVKPMICGSVEKDTWLSKKYELDLFLLFKPEIDKKVLEKDGLDIAKRIVKTMKGRHQISFAEHPYMRAWVGKFQIDIVPCYGIEDPENIKSAVDRTPHHVKFVKKNLKNTDEVRLLKQFCISNKCYGADVKTLGFSGYLCELLVINYGSFMECVKSASKWRAGHVLTFENSDKEQAAKKFKSPLVVIDPVDRNRNVSAAISLEKFYTFVRACKEFCDKPKEDFFFKKSPKPYSIKQIKERMIKRNTRWYLLSFKKPEVIEDILYPQMKRCSKSIEKMLEHEGFKVLRSEFYCNKECVIILEMSVWHIPRVSKNIGPEVYSAHAEQFLKHYKDKEVFIEDDNWAVETENSFIDSYVFLKELVKKSKRELLERGIPSKIVPAFNDCKVAEGENAIRVMRKMPEDFRVFMKEYFERNLNVV
jgi:tRNA nucleotidyltransferase (CCA-adding enzyme)